MNCGKCEMKVAIMQPYFMPYIGYWQLMNAVDRFVILDDVNYIVRGYINRNSILLNQKPYRFTIPIEKASQNKLISETRLKFTDDKRQDLLLTIHNAYKSASFYKEVMPLLENIINYYEADLTGFLWHSLEKTMEYLGINTDVLLSSRLDKDQDLKGEYRIIEICRKLNADTYINPCGGRKLYNHDNFAQEGIQLFFLDTEKDVIFYDQGQKDFVDNLSIIDIMMFNDKETIQKFLGQYKLGK